MPWRDRQHACSSSPSVEQRVFGEASRVAFYTSEDYGPETHGKAQSYILSMCPSMDPLPLKSHAPGSQVKHTQ